MAFSFTLIADDYALSPGVSAGVREALAAGRLSGTGCMTSMPYWPQESRRLKEFAGQAQIGLHLNLTAGVPLTMMPLAAPLGRFPGIGTWIRASRNAQFPAAEIRAEIAAQIDAFVQHFGRTPDFLDGHQHVHVLPGVAEIVLAELGDRGLAGKLWLRNSADRLVRIAMRRSQPVKAAGIAWLARSFAAQAQAAGFATNDGFAGFSSFDPAQDYSGQFARYLVAPGTGHLVMCHPGHVDAALAAADPVTTTREQELSFLLSDRFEAVLAERQAVLVRGFGK